uniref:Uncharacterized protein n=1 Tax=Arion vulgaris TaxID=1028688 RepID=A0A0B6Z8H4_9EUPU
MEMLKLLNDAKASGLSKEEFFHLIELEIKLNESKKTETVDHEKLLQDLFLKLETQQQHHLEILQQNVRDICEKQTQQLQHQFHNLQQQLQQQQESQYQHLQQIQVQQHLEDQQFQQHIKRELLAWQQHTHKLPQREEHNNDSNEQTEQMRTNVSHIEHTMKEMKDEFLEMRTSVFNKLESEKIFMRDSLSKAQNDILSLLLNAKEDMRKVKEIIEKEILTGLDKQLLEQLQQFNDKRMQTSQKTHNVDQEHKSDGKSSVKATRSSMFDPHSAGEFDSPF